MPTIREALAEKISLNQEKITKIEVQCRCKCGNLRDVLCVGNCANSADSIYPG